MAPSERLEARPLLLQAAGGRAGRSSNVRPPRSQDGLESDAETLHEVPKSSTTFGFDTEVLRPSLWWILLIFTLLVVAIAAFYYFCSFISISSSTHGEIYLVIPTGLFLGALFAAITVLLHSGPAQAWPRAQRKLATSACFAIWIAMVFFEIILVVFDLKSARP